MDRNTIKKMAELACIAVSEAEIMHWAKELPVLLHLAKKMDEVDTLARLPLAHPYEEKQPLRDDAVTEEDQRELLQTLAPLIEDALYLVPPVISNG